MSKAAHANPRIRFIEDMAEGYAFGPDAVTVRTASSGEITARLVVAADGRRSPARRAARIATRVWEYPQDGDHGDLRPSQAARRRLDRVPHPPGSVHVRAPARPMANTNTAPASSG